MADKKPGYQYNIFDQIESDKQIQIKITKIRTQKQEYQDAIDKLQKELKGVSNETPEDRNYSNSIKSDIRFNEAQIAILNDELKKYEKNLKNISSGNQK